MSFTEATFADLLRRNPLVARQYAGRARTAARKLRVPPPAWAASASPQVPEPATQRALPLESLVVPPELSSWRAQSSDRVVCMSVEGVRLVAWHGYEVEARYSTVADALAAITAGTVKWRATPRKVDQPRSNRAINA